MRLLLSEITLPVGFGQAVEASAVIERGQAGVKPRVDQSVSTRATRLTDYDQAP